MEQTKLGQAIFGTLVSWASILAWFKTNLGTIAIIAAIGGSLLTMWAAYQSGMLSKEKRAKLKINADPEI